MHELLRIRAHAFLVLKFVKALEQLVLVRVNGEQRKAEDFFARGLAVAGLSAPLHVAEHAAPSPQTFVQASVRALKQYLKVRRVS